MNRTAFFLLLVIILISGCKNETLTIDTEHIIYQINENSDFQDFLTPNYYNTSATLFRDDVNKLIHFARLDNYQHPFQSPNGTIPSFTTNRAFGDGIGINETSQHHPAIDLHPITLTDLSIYATHSGTINTYTNSAKYRHYLTITKDIKDSEENTIGKLVSLYAHIDLDLDASQWLQLDGLQVNKGDLVSKNLYSETTGGPHLHFEIRFYKNSEIGNEDFYNWQDSDNYTTQSSGSWSYGYWDPTVAYGFGNPINFGIQ